MALDPNIGDALNEQINKELYSAYLYLTFANYYEDRGLKGYANWYMVQVQEESAHAMILRRYLLDNDHPVRLLAIAEPDKSLSSDRDPLDAGLAHEEYITKCINDLVALAVDARDWRTKKLLDWYITEQAEEEVNASDMIKDYELFGGDPQGLYSLDKGYMGRSFTAPVYPL